MEVVLTIAVPSYNMEAHLPKNLPTYCSPRLAGRLEVLVLDNASQDRTGEIADGFAARYPETFRVLHRQSRGYGGSINQALAEARGKYFRIVDADDWVDTAALEGLVERLETCGADVVQTNYRRVVMGTGEERPTRFSGVEYGRIYTDFATCRGNVPCIHSVTYRTGLLRACGFSMQDGIFFVDEEYVILPFLQVKSLVYYDLDLYRYLVGNPTQSTSPANRARYAGHREQVVRRLLEAWSTGQAVGPARDYFFFRVAQAAGDHLTTLYLYLPDRREGLRRGLAWEAAVKDQAPDVYRAIWKKGFLLRLLCRGHVSLPTYERLKRVLLHK